MQPLKERPQQQLVTKYSGKLTFHMVAIYGFNIYKLHTLPVPSQTSHKLGSTYKLTGYEVVLQLHIEVSGNN